VIKKLLRSMTAAVLLGFICGCGGSGGTTFSISEQNVESIAGQGIEAVGVLEGMSELIDGYVALIGTEQSEVIDCVTGNVIVTVNDVGPQGIMSTGDSVTITFQACNIGLGIVFNGTISFSALTVSGTPGGVFSRTLETNLDGFSVNAGGASVVVNGRFTLHQSSTDGITVTSSVGGPSLTVFAQGGGEAFSGTISNFNLESSLNSETDDYTVTLLATVTNSRIGGAVNFETTTPFTGTGEAAPRAGTFVVSGPNGGTATLVALNETSVQILLDGDGDEVIDATILTTWDIINGSD